MIERQARCLAALVLLPLFLPFATTDAGGSPPAQPIERPRVLTLAGAIQEGLAVDPRIGAEAEAVGEAQAHVKTASQAPNPTVSLSKTLIPFGSSFTPDRQGGPPQLDLELAYPLDWLLFGKRGAAVTWARIGLEEAVANYQDFVRQRKMDIAVSFLDVIEARELLDLAEQDAADLDRLHAIAQQRVALGGAAAVEVDRLAVAVLEARREARRREAAFASRPVRARRRHRAAGSGVRGRRRSRRRSSDGSARSLGARGHGRAVSARVTPSL